MFHIPAHLNTQNPPAQICYPRAAEPMHITSEGLTLVHEDTGEPSCRNVVVLSFRGEPYVLVGGRAPQTVASTGKVLVRKGKSECEFYPSVFGLKWVGVPAHDSLWDTGFNAEHDSPTPRSKMVA